MMTTKEVLQRARGLISKRENWLTGSNSNGEGAYCAFGAVAEVTGWNRDATNAAIAALAAGVDEAALPNEDPYWGPWRGKRHIDHASNLVVTHNNTMGRAIEVAS
jgi:hypothetical protein